MAWDRETLEDEIQNEVDDFEADSLTVIRQAINDVAKMIWFRHDWTFRQATSYLDTDGIAQSFTIATQISNLAKVTGDSSIGFKNTGETAYRPLGFVPYSRFLRVYGNQAPSVGAPSVWTLYAGKIIFNTIPPALTDSISVQYAIEWVDLGADSDVPLIPEKYKAVIKSGVKASFWDFDDDVRGSAEWIKFQGPSYMGGLGGMIGDMLLEDNEQVSGPHRGELLGGGGIIFGRR